jgi:hypothetical protein
VQNQYYYRVFLHVDGQFGPIVAAIRNAVFIRELPLALEAIRYGDDKFFSIHPELSHVPIIVYFRSTFPQFNRIENLGTFSQYEINSSRQDMYLLDMKTGDVTGDGILDKVYLYGNKPEGAEGIFADNITVTIEDGRTNQTKTITPSFNSGYNARLFLGDFTKDKVADIKVSIDSGGSGGYGYYYIYSLKDTNLKEVFNFDKYNMELKYRVNYADLYKVNVGNVMLDKLFILDISYKGYDYLSQYYDENGKLKKPVQGEVLALSSLFPIVTDEKSNAFDILAYQRIIGISNSDALGFIENLLSWDGQKFVSKQMLAAIPGTNLISPAQL